MYFVSAEAFDDRDGYRLHQQIFIDEKPAYYDFANKTHNMTGAEVFAAFAPAATRPRDNKRHGRDLRRTKLHDQFRSAASGRARRAASGARARRRDRRARRSAYRAAASRHRKTDRAEDLSAGDPVFRPARLCRADEPGACLLPRGGKAARARSAAPRPTDPRAVLRDRPHPVASAQCHDAGDGRRRADAAALGLRAARAAHGVL